jgi:outer membrane protein OmpA-like peptidoglycan-associated protein
MDSAWRVCGQGAPCPKATPKTVSVRQRAIPHVGVPSAAVFEMVATTTETTSDKHKDEPERQTASIKLAVTANFAFASARLTGYSASKLAEMLPAIQPTDILIIEGHTDSIGSQSANDTLARRRAQAVAAWLISHGVENDLDIRSQGNCCYVSSNESETGRARNRRVEIRIVSAH